MKNIKCPYCGSKRVSETHDRDGCHSYLECLDNCIDASYFSAEKVKNGYKFYNEYGIEIEPKEVKYSKQRG